MLNESSANLEQFMSRQMHVLSSWAHLICLSYVQRPVFTHCALLFLVFPSSDLNCHIGCTCGLFSSSDVSRFYQLIVLLFSIASSPTCSFRYTSFPYFRLSSFYFLQRWSCPMNNSDALRDDNGKLEVRLCVARVCGRLADLFQPGGNRKGLFIHIIYVNKMTLLFEVSEREQVTTGCREKTEWWLRLSCYINIFPEYHHIHHSKLSRGIKSGLTTGRGWG